MTKTITINSETEFQNLLDQEGWTRSINSFAYDQEGPVEIIYTLGGVRLAQERYIKINEDGELYFNEDNFEHGPEAVFTGIEFGTDVDEDECEYLMQRTFDFEDFTDEEIAELARR